MNPRQQEGERGGCTIKRKSGGMVSEGGGGQKCFWVQLEQMAVDVRTAAFGSEVSLGRVIGK